MAAEEARIREQANDLDSQPSATQDRTEQAQVQSIDPLAAWKNATPLAGNSRCVGSVRRVCRSATKESPFEAAKLR